MLIVIDEIRRRFGSPSLYSDDQMKADAQIAEREARMHGEQDGEIYIARKIADAIRADGNVSASVEGSD